MTWVPAIALGGLILACGPVVIHILFRWRYRVVEFAAFRFLLESRKRSRQRLRLEELILILLRVLACVLLGLTLADMRSSVAPGGASAPAAHVFVLDDSLSMGHQAGGATLYQKAVQSLAGRLAGMADADSIAVVSACRPRGDVEAGLGRLLQAGEAKRVGLAARLAASRPTDLRADFPRALRTAAELLATRERMPARLYIVSDFRRSDFIGPEAAAALRGALVALDQEAAEITLLDFGLPCRNNLAIERVEVGRNVVVWGLSTPVRVIIRNTGQESTAATKLDVAIGDLTMPVQPVPGLAPGETAQVEFACTFDASGGAAVRVSLPPDDLPGDSTFTLALEVREALRVLILDGSPHPDDVESASFALAQALDPSGKGAFGRRVEVQAAATWTPASLSAYDLVILTNVREFPSTRGEQGQPVYAGLRALEDFVRAGGGLAIFLGDAIHIAFYNGPLYADGQGLSPLPLAEGKLPEPNREKFFRLNPESVRESPMLRMFSSRGPNFSPFVRFYACVPASAQPGEAAGAPQILAAFDNGLPAVCRRAYGKGAVLVWYSSADTRWSNWPGDLSFLPVMNEMAWALARQAENVSADVVGRSLGYTLPPRLSGALSAVLKTPAYPREDVHILPLQDDGQQRTVLYFEPPHAGLYELTLALADRTEHRVLFSRHTDPRESDLVKAPEADLRAAVGRTCRYTPNLAVQSETAAEAPPLKTFWWLFLSVLLVLLALETVLGLRFGHYLPRAKNAPEETR